jgi:hypothetical protein
MNLFFGGIFFIKTRGLLKVESKEIGSLDGPVEWMPACLVGDLGSNPSPGVFFIIN